MFTGCTGLFANEFVPAKWQQTPGAEAPGFLRRGQAREGLACNGLSACRFKVRWKRFATLG
ncbi:hypothetical protein PSCICF_19080 [Pseudomonas cichorii]|nr:hypothetical protein PSCICF_19080 [Pseudomonas cichorii]